MSISIYIEPITNSKDLIRGLLQTEFGISEKYTEYLYNNYLRSHIDRLKDSIYLLVETSYVDKVYRDSYYNYFSSKLSRYYRDCIRISFFDGEIAYDDFYKSERHENLQEIYRGFIVLRPIEPNIIGRSLISPVAMKTNNFHCCTATYSTTANGVKFKVNAFPHSSQDAETISCAETTLWALMEYFSTKYSEYTPVLPSKITSVLRKVTSERQVPSKGLNVSQISFALKEFGFGTRIYSVDQYRGDFYQLLSCYIESGIPTVVAMKNAQIGHALIVCGQEQITSTQIDNLNLHTFTNINLSESRVRKNISIYDYSEIEREYIFVDDNFPVYQRASFNTPANHYPSSWHDCRISFFIVPLYTKIYLEAFEAKNYVYRFLLTGPSSLKDDSTILIRFYLASSRSFKNSISSNELMQNDIKQIIVETSMPKFIWITELSTKDLIKEKKANGIVIIDATEANLQFNKPLILAAFQDTLVELNEETGNLEVNSLPLQDFLIYENNLNPFI